VNRTTGAREPDDRRVPRLVVPLPLAPRCRDDQPAKVTTSLVADRRFARRPAGSPEEAFVGDPEGPGLWGSRTSNVLVCPAFSEVG
jgi:hypothetical protein